MTLPKYLNLFQEVRLERKQLEAGDLVMKVAQGNGLPDVVGMRLDDVKKSRDLKVLKFFFVKKWMGQLKFQRCCRD
jgi:hypothetical protein